MLNNIDFYLSYNFKTGVVESFDSGQLYRVGLIDDSILLSAHEPLVEDEHFHGIKIEAKNNKLSVRNDFFCTIPTYYTKVGGMVYVSSNPELLIGKLESVNIDKAGVWEVILYGSALYDRTPVREVYQLPPMHELLVDDKGSKISKYHNLEFYEDKTRSPDDIIEDIHERLDEIFSSFSKNENYIMGVSGGLDSRLSLGYLKNNQFIDKVRPFTFFASKNSMELKLATRLCEELGFKKTEELPLFTRNYSKFVNIFGSNTCGQIGFHHSHINQCLKSLPEVFGKSSQISNYFTDAVFGWATNDCKVDEDDSWTLLINSVSEIPEDVKSTVLSDIRNVFSGFSDSFNFSSRDEYKYIFERNQKFHMNLAFQQSREIKTYLPYCDYKLMRLVYSLPLEIRSNKYISEVLILKSGLKIRDSISSRQMVAGKGFSQKRGVYRLVTNLFFKASNATSLLVSKLSFGKIIFSNRYQTEAHYNLFHQLQSKGVFCDDINYLQLKGVFSTEESTFFKKLSLRNGGVSSFFQLHQVASYLRKLLV